MKVQELINFIPKEDLEVFASETKVDYQVKKLNGSTMFQLLLFSLLHHQKASLRIMEKLYSSMRFRMLSGIGEDTTRYNSIRDRVATMNPDFFEKIFYSLFDNFNKLFKEEDKLIRYDSTMISLSSNLLQWGMKSNNKQSNKSQIKYTIATKGSFPCYVKIFSEQKAFSEDIALSNTILENEVSKTGVIVFDRGIQSRKTYKKLTDENIVFVTRARTDIVYQLVKKLKIPKNLKSGELLVDCAMLINLKKDRNNWCDRQYRLIKAYKKNGNCIYFLTNDLSMEHVEICELYKKRWEIEVFFKFLKQHLNLKHLLTRNKNGIKVMVYMTLILSILLIAYKKIKGLN